MVAGTIGYSCLKVNLIYNFQQIQKLKRIILLNVKHKTCRRTRTKSLWSWIRQLFPKYDTSSIINNRKKINCTSKLKTFVL